MKAIVFDIGQTLTYYPVPLNWSKLYRPAFVGDESKDMECARNAGVKAILINRTDEKKDFGQDIVISDLNELIRYL